MQFLPIVVNDRLSMTQTWFIGDTHFGHKRILEYEPHHRPFHSIEEMHEKIIENWNKKVRSSDLVYHLGDFALDIIFIDLGKCLNGRKKLIMGNHDKYDIRHYSNYFEYIYGSHVWKKCILTHIPVHPNSLGSRFILNIHGHLHSKSVKCDEKDDLRYFNVSCERNNLTPIHCDEILERIKLINQYGYSYGRSHKDETRRS